jgi:hypothetical protein
VPEKAVTRSQPSRMASVETLGGFENVVPAASAANTATPVVWSATGSGAEAGMLGTAGAASDIDLRPWPLAAPVVPEPLSLWSAAAAAAVSSPKTAAGPTVVDVNTANPQVGLNSSLQ